MAGLLDDDDVGVPTQAPVYPEAVAPKIVRQDYKTALQNVKETPIASLLTHVSGALWTVDYYSQVLGSDDELSEWQPTQEGVYQQYMRIKKFEMRVTEALRPVQDTESASFTATGRAVLYPNFIPNAGDLFLALAGDGRLTQFNISQVERKTIFKETCYEITFEQVRTITPELLATLNESVVNDTTYRRDFVTYGQNPVIVDQDLSDIQKFDETQYTLLDRWLALFYSRRFSTILVPGQPAATYDPFLVRFIKDIFTTRDNSRLASVNLINCGAENIMGKENLWTILMDASDVQHDMMAQKLWVVPAKAFNRLPVHHGVYHSGIVNVVYPYQYYVDVDDDYGTGSINTTLASPTEALGDEMWSLTTIFPNAILGGLVYPNQPLGVSTPDPEQSGDIPLTVPVSFDDYYVFTKKFYDKDTVGISKLEGEVLKYLAGDALDGLVLNALIADVNNWGRMERFYYIPVLCLLLRYSSRRN